MQGERIAAAGASVTHPAGAEVIDLGDTTFMPGLIDAHVHLFLHPGAEDLQTVEESVPQRTILATLAARADLMAGFTAERDMGTEGAGSADTAVRNAINQGLIPGPRLRISGNAIDILGGHEDANRLQPRSSTCFPTPPAPTMPTELVAVIREQLKAGRRLHQDLRNRPRFGGERQTHHALPIHRSRAGRRGRTRPRAWASHVAVHATGEPGTLYAARSRVSLPSITLYQLSDETMRLMHEKHIFAVPTFTIFEYFVGARRHARSKPRASAQLSECTRANFRKQTGRRCAHRGGLRCRPVPAWHAGHASSAAGEVRHDAARPRSKPARLTARSCLAGTDRSAR